MRRPLLALLILLGAIAQIAAEPIPFRQAAPKSAANPTETAPQPDETSAPADAETAAAVVAFVVAVPSTCTPSALIAALNRHPAVPVTLVLPPSWEPATAARWQPALRALAERSQIEIALTVEGMPVLPLLGSTRLAEPARTWPFAYEWPADIGAHLSMAVARHQTLWGRSPVGLAPPFFAASDRVAEAARRAHLKWLLTPARDKDGVLSDGGLSVVVPRPPVAAAGAEWPDSESVFLWDATGISSAPAFLGELRAHLAALERKAAVFAPVTLTAWTERAGDRYALSPDTDPYQFDYAPWTAARAQRRAWQVLAQTRSVLESYTNSGAAQLRKLDAATAEITSAHNGLFLRDLGVRGAVKPEAETAFLATLAQVHRLAGVPVPERFYQALAAGPAAPARRESTKSDKMFSITSPTQNLWNDAAGDDKGPGAFTYPTAIKTKGALDLRRVTLSWSESEVTLLVGFGAPISAGLRVTPFLDAYIDINRISGVGETGLLSGRGAGAIAPEAAWEFAVAISPRGATLYQALPGEAPRTIGSYAVVVNPKTGTVGVTLPRTLLRGLPEAWRLTAAAGAAVTVDTGAPPEPCPAQPTAGEAVIGGAVPGRTPSHYLDLLVEDADEQTERLRAYETGSAPSLPFVDARR